MFCKLDMLALAAQGLYHNLSTTIEVALACRFKPLFEDEECPNDAFTRFTLYILFFIKTSVLC